MAAPEWDSDSKTALISNIITTRFVFLTDTAVLYCFLVLEILYGQIFLLLSIVSTSKLFRGSNSVVAGNELTSMVQINCSICAPTLHPGLTSFGDDFYNARRCQNSAADWKAVPGPPRCSFCSSAPRIRKRPLCDLGATQLLQMLLLALWLCLLREADERVPDMFRNIFTFVNCSIFSSTPAPKSSSPW